MEVLTHIVSKYFRFFVRYRYLILKSFSLNNNFNHPYVRVIRILSLTVFFCLHFSIGTSQNRNEIIGDYIYNLGKHTEIDKSTDFKTYNIVLVSEDPVLKKEFRKIITRDKIKEKSIYLIIHKDTDINFHDACIVFVAADKSHLYGEIFDKTENQQVLLVSDNYYDKRKIMLNLYETEKGQLRFEINKANIYDRKIKLNNDILLKGGREVDIIQLYLQTKRNLNNTEGKIKDLNNELSELNNHIKSLKDKSQAIEDELEEKTKLIKSQKREQEKLKNIIKENESYISDQDQQKKKDKKMLLELSDQLLIGQKALEDKKNEYEEEVIKYRKLKKEIESINNEIIKQEELIGNQDLIISKQIQTRNFITIILILFFLLAALLLFAFISGNRKNKLLRTQKEEISVKNTTLADQMNEIQMYNEQLMDKNDELESLLEKLKKTQQQLIQSEKMASLGVLTAGIAHEINNPVNFIFAGINSLHKDFEDISLIVNLINDLSPDDSELKQKLSEINDLKEQIEFEESYLVIPELINHIRIGAERTAEIVEGLKQFSRSNDKNFILADIKQAVSPALLMLRNKYKNRIQIIEDYDSVNKKVEMKPGSMTQVFMNILINAIDAIQDKGVIHIQTKYLGEKVYITISDNGRGIQTDKIDKIFDPFFTTKEVGEGTGLGLAITYGIIKDHFGDIKVESELNIGSKFIIELPIRRDLMINN
jgi:signal transduction histidine kinase